MRVSPKSLDLAWSEEGDFLIRDGRIYDTKNEAALSFIQALRDRLGIERGSWKLFPEAGISINSILGKGVNRNAGTLVEQAIADALTSGGFLNVNEFTVTSYPADKSTIGVRLRIQTKDLPKGIVFVISYDTRNNRVSLRKV